MARTRGTKSDDDMLVKSAEFVGWALGGLEREITQTILNERRKTAKPENTEKSEEKKSQEKKA